MGIIALHWYNRNETRNYPLDDVATATDQIGNLLPTDIIADMHISYPDVLGRFPFVSAVTITKTLISVVLQVYADPNNAATVSPLGVISLVKPAQSGRSYPIQAQIAGVGGWIVFGHGINAAYTGKFDFTAGQLAPRACRGYRLPPVQSIAVLNSAVGLEGVVRLRGESPITITGEIRSIGGIEKQVAVIRLAQTAQGVANVFVSFAGPCNGRPESQNCGPAMPIEYVDAVQPDCNGNLTIELQGCANVAAVDGGAQGVVIDCGLGLSAACLAKKLPDSNGRLPNTYSDLCVDLSGELPADGSPPPVDSFTIFGGGDGGGDGGGTSESITVLGHLPHIETFDLDNAAQWRAVAGGFEIVVDFTSLEPITASEISGIYMPADFSSALHPPKAISTETRAATRNIILWDGWDTQTAPRTYKTALKILTNTGTAKHNGGLVLNYLPGTNPYSSTWFLIEADYDNQQFSIKRFNGTMLTATGAVASLVNLYTNKWYEIEVTTSIIGSQGNIVASLIDDESHVTELTLLTNNYLPDTGKVGFHADRSETRFAYLAISED